MIKFVPNFSIPGPKNDEYWGSKNTKNSTLVIVDSFEELEAACKKLKPKQQTHEVAWHGVYECFSSIREGNSSKNVEIAQVAREVAERALVIEPNLSEHKTWAATEISDIWCAGAIAEEHPEPCFLRTRATGEPTQGRGDGAYRIIINTDHMSCNSPAQGAITMGALILVLAQYSPVEIWIQQGWLGNSPNDGITLFPIHRGHLFNPSTLWFWLGDPRKDHTFSYLVNRHLFHRTSTGVSCYPAIPCDLYLSSMQVGHHDFSRDDLAKYVSTMCSAILFNDSEKHIAMQ